MSEAGCVSLWIPGRRTGRVAKTTLVSTLILLTVLSSVGTVLPGIVQTFGAMFSSLEDIGRACPPSNLNATTAPGDPIASPCSTSAGGFRPNIPRRVGADNLPNLSLPKTIISTVDRIPGGTGVVTDSPQNLTLHGSALTLRLLGGAVPRDQILTPDRKVLTPRSMWGVEALTNGTWEPLLPSSNKFAIIGTNSTGTYVIRSMNVSASHFSGILTIVYRANSSGALKWDLNFTPFVSGHYRLIYNWWSITSDRTLSSSERQFQVRYGKNNFTLSWSDVSSLLNTTASLLSDRFVLSIDLGTLTAWYKAVVDPSLVASFPNSGVETYYNFQRHVFYEPKGGNYFAFLLNISGAIYSSSPDGVSWASPKLMPNGFPGETPDGLAAPAVVNAGQTVFAAIGDESIASLSRYENGTVLSSHVYFVEGNITGPNISWGNVTPLDRVDVTSQCATQCNTVSMTRFVNIALGSDGNLSFAYNAFTQTGTGCNSTLYVHYRTHLLPIDSLSGCPGQLYYDALVPILLPADSGGGLRVVYLSQDPASFRFSLKARSIASDGTLGAVERVDSTGNGNTFSFSAVSDSSYGTHVVYIGLNGNITYAYHSSFGSSWGYSKDIFSGAASAYPTITLDYSTSDVYVFGGNSTAVAMKIKHSTGTWTDGSVFYPVTGRSNGVVLLGSNLVSAGATNSSKISLIWSEWDSLKSVLKSVWFASIPIQTVWSPYATPSDPWDGNGIAPYGQYFANLGEYVSASSGMLTVKQTDLSVPGRGLNLDITRVYTEPYSFLSNAPYNYEFYPWAPMGDGWQLNFPWLSNSSYPLYIHLWDGEGYRIPSNFWSGFTATFENHQGENFRLVRNLDGSMNLYDKSGASYYFNTTSHRLAAITDPTGNNTITFNYSNNLISCLTDTVSRAFTLSYSGGLLQKISQVSGTCASPGQSIRSVVYGNNGRSLISVTDPANRATSYTYLGGPSNIAQWLLSRITYPTGWYANYTYTPMILGTQATTYRIGLQLVNSSSNSPIRQFAYTYTESGGDQVTGSTVTSYNETQVQSYTTYAFSFAGDTMNVSDASHNLLRGTQQMFGVNGQIPREIILVNDGQGHIGSYTNFYQYDLWGNQIYSRRVINNSTGAYHETFNSYYNDGEPPGFYAFQDSFSQDQGTAADNPWNVVNGYWMVNNGVYNGTEASGPLESNLAVNNIGRADISMQARVYVGRQINVTAGVLPRLGIFAHYTGGKYKWALDIINETSSGSFLELHDEWYQWLGVNGQPSAKTSCPLVKGAWYTFNMTVHGFYVSGWASTQGQATCTVSGIFSTSSPAAGGNGFGLSAGGYSALFDDVQVTTVSLLVTGTGFSDSFVQNSAPGPVGLNTWLTTTKPPSSGWNTIANWLPATGWSQAYPIQNYGQSPWGNIPNWHDTNAQWIWWSTKANVSASLDPAWFRRTINLNTATNVSIEATTDNYFTLYVDGLKVLSGTDWTQRYTNQTTLGRGYHVFALSTGNTGGPAGLLLSASDVGTGQIVFRTDGKSGPVITAIAGTAELQNGPLGLLEESYYGYTPWGGLSQTKSRYDPNPLAIDSGAIAQCSNSTTSCSVALTTSHANDIIIVDASETLDMMTSCTFSVNDTRGLSWTSRSGVVHARGGRDQLQEFYAKSANILSSDSITESISGCTSNGGEYNGLLVFAITGANFNTPFDPASGLPATNHDDINSAAANATITTSTPGDLVFAGLQHGGSGVPATQPGFISAISTSGYGVESTIASGTLTSFPVTFGFSPCSFCPWEMIADAVQPSGRVTTQWLTTTGVYDFYGNPRTSTDSRGNVTTYGYSSAYQSAYLTGVNETLVPGGTLISHSYSYNFTMGTMLSSVDPDGYNTVYKYDILGRTTKATYPNNDFVSYTYNDPANYVNITNENGWLTQKQYDGLGRLSTVDRFLSGKLYSNATNTYNWQDKTVTTRDPVGNTYYYSYDPLGRITNSTTPDRKSVLQSYNDLLAWTRTTDQDGNYRCNYYDRLGRLISVVEYADSRCNPRILNGNNYVTNYYYDEVGNLRTLTNAATRSTTYSYDNLNRLTTTSYPDGTSETYGYDNDGNLVSKVDRLNLQTGYSYDSLNRVANITYNGITTTKNQYAYDRNGNMLSLQSQNASLTYSYDSRNRILGESYSVNGGSSQFDFRLSNPTNITLYQGGSSTTSITLTLLGGTSNPVSVYCWTGLPSGTTCSSSIGYPTFTTTLTITTSSSTPPGSYPITVAASNPWHTAQFTLKVLRCTSNCPQLPQGSSGSGPTSGPLSGSPSTPAGVASAGYSFSYSYTGETLSSMTYSDGLIVNYTYDSLGRVAGVAQFYHPYSTYASFTYYQNDQVKGVHYGNGLAANYTYDHLGRILNVTASNRGTVLLSLIYSFNNTGTVASVIGKVNGVRVNEQYSYDPLKRLVNSLVGSGTNTTISYVLDNIGNRLNQTLNGVSTNYVNDGTGNELKSSSIANGPSILYSYNLDGNLLSRNVTSGTVTMHWSYAWDAAGNLLRLSNDTGLQGIYGYDGLNRRLESKEGSSATFYAYSGTDTLAEQSATGVGTDYIYAAGLRIARVSQGTTVYYQSDALGSTRLVTSSTGTVLFCDNYQPYGQDNGTATGSETYKFTGKPFSVATGLYYYFHRWYDPSIGRFISPDPKHGKLSNPQSLNLYIYVLDRPTSLTDPTGLDSCGWNPLSWGGCASNAGQAVSNWWNSQDQQTKIAIVLVVATVAIVATAGLAAPAVLPLIVTGIAVGATTSVATYAATTVATGGTITAEGLFTSAATGAFIGAATAGILGEFSGAGQEAADEGFSATRPGVGTFGRLGDEIGVKHLDAIAQAGGKAGYLGLIQDTVENGVDTSSIEATNPAYLTLRSTTSKFFVVADPQSGTIVTAFYNTPSGPLASLWNMLLAEAV